MSQSVSRQQRRKMERNLRKKQGKSGSTEQTPTNTDYVTKKEMQLLVQDMQKVLNYSKLVDNHVWMLVETLDRKGVLNWSDVNETENLYAAKENKKQTKIKELLERDLSLPEALEVIKEPSDLPGYERLEIDPIKDLNFNPYEVGIFLREEHPDLSKEDYLKLGKVWNLTLDHFGFRQEKTSK